MREKYKLVYENAKVIKGSVSGIPAVMTDTSIIDLGEHAGKMVYEKEGGLYVCGETNIPAPGDVKLCTIEDLISKPEEEPVPEHAVETAEVKATPVKKAAPKAEVKTTAKK